MLRGGAVGAQKDKREESLDDCCRDLGFFPSVEATLQHQHVRDREKDLGVTALHLLFELRVLLARAFDQLTKADQLLALITGDKVCAPETPSLLKASDQVDELGVVGQLRVHNLDVFGVPVNKEVFHVVEAALNVRAQLPNGDTLTRAHFPADFVRNHQHGEVHILPALAYAVGNLVDLADVAQEFVAQIVVLLVG